MNRAAQHRAIRAAIRARRYLRVRYDGGERLVQPHLVYQSKGERDVLHAWHTKGDSVRKGPHWCNLSFDELTAIQLQAEHFEPRPDYNPRSPNFHRVLYGIDVPEL
jgi:hypothetical protein